MRKFDSSQWADFVRGVADPELEQAMREHVETDGARAAMEESLWRRVAAVGKKDLAVEPPDHAVRVAKAIAGLRRPDDAAARAAPGLRRLPFEILFDSLQAAPAGVRSSASEARHLVVESGAFTVDVRLEPPPRSGDAAGGTVAGQILRSNGEVEPLERTPVLVFSGDDIVASALSSASGEFRADGLPEGPVNLCLLIGGEECIEVPLGVG